MSIGIFPIIIQRAKYDVAHFPNSHQLSDFSSQFCRQKMIFHSSFVLMPLFQLKVQIVSNHACLGNTFYTGRNLWPNFGQMSQKS